MWLRLATDMHKQIDGFAAAANQVLKEDGPDATGEILEPELTDL